MLRKIIEQVENFNHQIERDTQIVEKMSFAFPRMMMKIVTFFLSKNK
jgi:hypothetical protein